MRAMPTTNARAAVAAATLIPPSLPSLCIVHVRPCLQAKSLSTATPSSFPIGCIHNTTMAAATNFVELADADELTEFLNTHQKGCVITFSASWCGPCKATKPRLQNEIAPPSPVPIGYVLEEDIDDFLRAEEQKKSQEQEEESNTQEESNKKQKVEK